MYRGFTEHEVTQLLAETARLNARRGPIMASAKRRKPAPTKPKADWDFVAVSRARATRENCSLRDAMAFVAQHSPRRYAAWGRAQQDSAQKRPTRKPAPGGEFMSAARAHATKHKCSLFDSLAEIQADNPERYEDWVRGGCS